MIVQFATLEGENKGPQIDVPLGSTVLQMEELMNQLLENKDKVRIDLAYIDCGRRVLCYGLGQHAFRVGILIYPGLTKRW